MRACNLGEGDLYFFRHEGLLLSQVFSTFLPLGIYKFKFTQPSGTGRTRSCLVGQSIEVRIRKY